MFDAIHVKRQRIRSKEALAAFYKDYGIDPDVFIKQYDSFAVDMKLKQGESRARGYGITGRAEHDRQWQISGHRGQRWWS